MTLEDIIVLFDMDGTLCDFEGGLLASMLKLKSPDEPIHFKRDKEPEFIKARERLIKSSVQWWANLDEFSLGMDIWYIVHRMGLRKMILTQGPRNNANALAGKKLWIDEHLGSDVEFTMTRDKGLVYGNILVDDWPEYIERWLKWRKRGLVIMPAGKHNVNFFHPQVIRYDGNNRDEIESAIKEKVENILKKSKDI